MSRVLFVLKYRELNPNGTPNTWGEKADYGNPLHSGLFNSATFVCDMLNSIGIESKLVHVLDNNYIHREIVAFKPTHVIIEAFWVVPEKFEVLRQACPGVIFIIRNHSETPFLSNEGIAFEWTLKYLEHPNVVMSCNAKRMLEETRFLARQKFPKWSKEKVEAIVPYLPNYYPIFPTEVNRYDSKSPVLNVGCFGAIRPLKNHVEQAIAAMKLADRLGKKLNFHINDGRVEGNGQPILKNLKAIFAEIPKHNLIAHPWKSHGEFKSVVKSMDLVTQVTFSETFNIVLADAVSQGVPVVSSREVPWTNPLIEADPTSSDDIADKMELALFLKRTFSRFNPSLSGLKSYNAKSIQEWGKYFSKG